MQDLILTSNRFDSNPFWDKPLKSRYPVAFADTNTFDQNGYDLCSIEQSYAIRNSTSAHSVRNHRTALVQNWMTQSYKKEGAVLNHSNLFERKGYTGEALEQLKSWASDLPIFYRLINIRPKWGLDFSMDYYDSDGNTFEVLHWEYDGFDVDEIQEMKEKVEPKLLGIDWDDAAVSILKHKNEWYNLDFFAQSAWKCKHFGICEERWKMVVWK